MGRNKKKKTKVEDLREKATTTGAELTEKLSIKLEETKNAAKEAAVTAKQHAPEPVQRAIDKAVERVEPEPVAPKGGGKGKKLVLGGVVAAILVVVFRGLSPK